MKTVTPDLSAFGSPRILQPLTGGYRNRAFLTDLNGSLYVAKSTCRRENQVNWMAQAMGLAAATGLRIPMMVRSQIGTYISGGYTLETFLPGRLCQAGEVPDISRAILDFQTTSQSLPQRPGFVSCADLLIQQAGGDINLSKLPTALRLKVRSAFQAIAQQPQATLHGDLGEINLLIQDGLPPALIDWDESRRDCAFFDLQRLPHAELSQDQQRACLAFEIATCWQNEPEYSQNLARKLT